MLFPAGSPMLSPEQRLPSTSVLTGLAWDYTDASVVTYDKTETKLIWINSSNGTIITSAVMDTPVNEVIGMSAFQDQLYILTYEGDGHLKVFTGSLSQGRKDSTMYVVEHEVPYSTANPYNLASLFQQSHSLPVAYLRYHPDFCNIFHIGASVYLLLGIANNVTSGEIPRELGQYIVEYDLSGVFTSQVKIDQTDTGRKATILGLNGTAVSATYHDGAVVLLCRELGTSNPNVIHAISYKNNEAELKDTFWYLPGSVNPYGDIMVKGRWAFTLIGNKIMKSEVIMIALNMEAGWPSQLTVDLGTLSSGQIVYRRISCKNISPVTTYKELAVTSTDPNLSLSAKDAPDKYDYSDKIVIEGDIKPNDTFTFWACLTAPVIRNDEYAPYQYYNKLVFVPKSKIDHEE